MEVKTKLNIKIKDNKKVKFMCLILNTKGTKNSFNGKILGLTLPEWIKFACGDIPTICVDFDRAENVLDFAKKHIDFAYDYTIILFSKTPLVTQETIRNIMEYCEIKRVNLCKLHSGYVVNNEYIKNTSNYFVDSVYSGDLEDFYIVENKNQYTYAFKILSTRINDFHIASGVDIVNPNNTYIEPYVDIEKNVKIYPNNTLKGKTTIGRDVVLKEGNTIEDSKIGSNSCLSHSNLIGSVLGENVFVGSFSEIKNSLISKNTIVENKCVINNYNVKSDSVIKSNSNLGEDNDSSSGIR